MSKLTLEELDDWKQNDPGGLDADEILKLIAGARAHLEGKHILDLWEWFRQRGNYAACSEIFCYARDHGFKLDYPKLYGAKGMKARGDEQLIEQLEKGWRPSSQETDALMERAANRLRALAAENARLRADKVTMRSEKHE